MKKKITRKITEEVKLETFYDTVNKQIVEHEVTYYDGITKEKIPENLKPVDSKSISRTEKKYEVTMEKFMENAQEVTR